MILKVFRHYPETVRGLYVRVIVHDTQASLQKEARARQRAMKKQPYFPKPAGCCFSTARRAWRRGRWVTVTSKCVADVLLCTEHLGTETVTHEMFHAVMDFARRVTPDALMTGAVEERIATAHGKLCRLFVTAAIEHGLYAPEDLAGGA